MKTSDTAIASSKQEVESLTQQLATSTTKTSSSDPPLTDDSSADLSKKVSSLESDLREAQSSADSAAARATSLEQKIEALTKLHREAATTTGSRDREITDLKKRLEQAKRVRAQEGGEELSDLEDEEREKLNSRIRDLEAETFELRRGVWRDKRAQMQPGMNQEGNEEHASPGYDDVDLSAGGASQTSYAARPSIFSGAKTSSFQDVLQSGINAFTGKDRRQSGQHANLHDRKASLGLLDEDDFDEDAYRVAQQQEGMRRIERVKEIKRGLEQWRAWRMDLVDLRAGGIGGGIVTGPIFDI